MPRQTRGGRADHGDARGGPDVAFRDITYHEEPTGLYRAISDNEKKVVYQQLTNFTARIVAELLVTDGASEYREFEIETRVDGQVGHLNVRAEDFASLEWIIRELGAKAICAAGGPSSKDHIRAAIQWVSSEIRTVRVFTHIGWVKVDGRWFYLHAGGAIGGEPPEAFQAVSEDRPHPNSPSAHDFERGGAIGAEGAVSGATPFLSDAVRVRTESVLPLYTLPSPPRGERLVRAVRASLDLIELGPDHLTMPPYAAVCRAPLGNTTYSIWLEGGTGKGKSAFAALLQQHWGADMDPEHLPGSWSSTANSLEALAFHAKDALLTIDDRVLVGSKGDVDKSHRDSDRLLRSQGNGSGRSRCSRDGTPKAAMPPRGTLLITAEDAAEGHSANARLLRILFDGFSFIEQSGSALDSCQTDAKEGLYAEAMAGYLEFLAPDLDVIRERMKLRMETFRMNIKAECKHPRTATIVSDLMAGFEIFLDYALATGSIDDDEYLALFDRMSLALYHSIKEQNRHLATNDPLDQFFDLLAAAFLGGRLHVSGLDGSAPEKSPRGWGWRERRAYVPRPGGWAEDPHDDRGGLAEPQVRLEPQGRHVGWVSGDDLYLIPEVAFAGVQDLARSMGQYVRLTVNKLGRALSERGRLRSQRKGRNLARINVGGCRPEVLHLDAGSVVRDSFFGPPWMDPEYEGPPLEALIQDRVKEHKPWDHLLLA